MQASTTPPAGITDLRTLLAVLLCLITTPLWGWPARVERVIDGDTIEVRADRRPVTVRIFGIDAPERGQSGGDAARAALTAMIEGRRVDVDALGPDRYGRTVARIDRQGRDVGLSLVRAGHAWQFTRYDDSATLRAAELFARRNHLGLWADPTAQAPGSGARMAGPSRWRCGPPAATIPRAARNWLPARQRSTWSSVAAPAVWTAIATAFRARRCARRQDDRVDLPTTCYTDPFGSSLAAAGSC